MVSMSIELTKEDEEVVNRLVNGGEFRNANEAVHEALKRLSLRDGFPFEKSSVYPPGSLLHLYTAEENEQELRIVRSHEKKLEAF